ncbi:MAG TPA: GNAT family N-acetyltransferase [Acidobacteriaceae bacterium]|nr:GNAT family N-acetyltransferase [Acidobacteriaceae bacterium]
MDAATIRPATLEDLPLLLRYRRAMAEEVDTPDPVAVDRMIGVLEPYLREAMPQGRWHAWIAEPGGCGAIEIVRWVPGRLDPTPRRAWIHSVYVEPSLRRRGIGRQLTEAMVAWCREQGFQWIYLHASEQGRPLYQSLGFQPSSEMRLKL